MNLQQQSCNLLGLLPEELLLNVLSLLDVSDLYNTCLVNSVWRRLCEDDIIFRTVSKAVYPCLNGLNKPPFEDTWKDYYISRKESFCVLGGPVSQSACMDDICGKLRAAGLPRVDGIFCQKRIPTLEELQRYSAVLVYSYNSSAFLDGSLMGDLLADYVDNGGGVVVTVFTNCNNLRNGFVKGRFLDGGYHPIVPARQHDTNGKRPLILGRVLDQKHPIMSGIETVDGGRSSFFCPGSVNPKGHAICEWSNGAPLVVELGLERATVVGVNLFPPSSDTGDPRFWQANTDGGRLLANALAFAGHSTVLRKHVEEPTMVRDSQGNWIAKPVEGKEHKKDRMRELYKVEESFDRGLSDGTDGRKRRSLHGAKLLGRRIFHRLLSSRKLEQ